jgi:radical SAM protein
MRDFSEAPFLVIWETTQACDLACRHCRASARPGRDPNELTTTEALKLLEEVKGFGDPLLVFTGGDPLKRPDLFTLLSASVSLGLRTTITPSATPLLDRPAVERIQECGVARMALSIDGPDTASHDDFRQVAGSFDTTLRALEYARGVGLETQINSTVTRRNLHRLPEMADLVEKSGARLWSVFFLIVTGRAMEADDLTAEEYERVFEFLYRTASRGAFDVKTTEAQHYRRYAAQRRKLHGGQAAAAGGGSIARQAGINDGKGFVFVSHTGEIFPSGFLEVSAGNVRNVSLRTAYRTAPLFQVLRDSSSLEGKCGACEYRNLCGGSRSRAYALTGNFLASDPRCVYIPGNWKGASAIEAA